MKKRRNSNPAIRSSFALAIWSQVRPRSVGQVKMMERCQALQILKRKVKEDIETQVAELAQYVARMKRAPDEKKIGLMNAFLTHMAEHQIAMNARQATLQEEMMAHMLQHIQLDNESILKCAAICENV